MPWVAGCARTQRPASALVVGAGNIGSHLLGPLARAGVGRIVVVDRDRYEARNASSQAIAPRDVGRPKAEVQVAALRRLHPELDAQALVGDLREVPLGRLRADVAFACLDSRRARLDLGERLWRLGVPLVDAGVRASGWLVRVSAFVPTPTNACYACNWSEEDYAGLEAAHSCADALAPTDAPAALGALAASLAVASFLSAPEPNREIVLDAACRRFFHTRLERDPACRFDHQVWPIEPLPRGAETLADAAALLGAAASGATAEVEGQSFAGRVRCRACGEARAVWHLASRLPRRLRRCHACSGGETTGAYDIVEPLRLAALPEAMRRKPLRRLGLATGDVLTLTAGATQRHFELQPQRPVPSPQPLS